MKHTIVKSYELLNSEGPIVIIQKDSQYWHWKFFGCNELVITTPKEILNFISGLTTITDPKGTVYDWKEHEMGMKGDNPEYIKRIVNDLIQDELFLCNNDPDYFFQTYCLPK